MKTQHSYQVRPGYGSKELLIEFLLIDNVTLLVKDLLFILDQLGFKSDGEVLLIDDQWLSFLGPNGNVTVTIDIWDLVFILADKNQKDITLIDQCLNRSILFNRKEVDFEEYSRGEISESE